MNMETIKKPFQGTAIISSFSYFSSSCMAGFFPWPTSEHEWDPFLTMLASDVGYSIVILLYQNYDIIAIFWISMISYMIPV